MTRHYKPRTPNVTGWATGAASRLGDRYAGPLAQACKVAGIDPPSRAADIAALVGEMPTVDTVARRLATEATTATDLTKWRRDSLRAMTEAQAADAIRAALTKYGASTAERTYPATLAAVVDDLAAAFDRTAAKLTEAAQALPDGDPLDLDAVVAAHATRERETATEALATLASLVTPIPRTNNPNAPADLLVAVTVPDVPQELHDSTGRRAAAPSTDRDTIRSLYRTWHTDPDRALIEVAAGRHGPNIELRLARTADEVTDRQQRWQLATTTKHIANAEPGEAAAAGLTACQA